MKIFNFNFYNIINSEKRASCEFVSIPNPRTGEPLWKAPVAAEQDLDDAVAAAQASFETWRQFSIEYRQECLQKLSDLLEVHREDFLTLLSKESGKSDLLTTLEINDAQGFLKFYAQQTLPDKVDFEDDEVKIVSTHVPIGVVAAICPWNFPLVLATAKIAASLLMGNCIIVKPSPLTPYTTLKFAELALSVLPRGVFQALNGGHEVGKLMTLHSGIDKISFTGSTATGKKVLESSAGTLKKVTLELGGNDASIVCDDVDIKTTAREVAGGCLYHSGQMCVATKRVYVHKSIFNEFRDSLVAAVREIIVNDVSGQQPSIFSPLQNHMQYQIVKDLIADCKEHAYDLLCGGEVDDQQPGFFIRPTVVGQPPDSSKVFSMEQFGPIIPLAAWSSEDEVIARANSSDSGLGASVWCADISRAEKIARKLEAGSVWINHAERPHPAGYFAGWKQSGVGGEWGRQGLFSYSQTQTLHFYKERSKEH